MTTSEGPTGELESQAKLPNETAENPAAAAARVPGSPNPLAHAAVELQEDESEPAPPPEVEQPSVKGGLGGVSFVMDVPVELSVEIGRRRTRIAELLQLSPGSVLELDTPAGDPLSIYVNKRLVARGEAVMVGDRYGIRIVELFIDKDDDVMGGQR